MQRSKHLALMFLLGAVIVGGALGFTADRVMFRDADRDSSRASLYEQLGLDDRQRLAVDSILDERHRQFNLVLKPVRPQLDSIRLSARAQIRQVLKGEQLARFEAILAEQQARDSSRKEKGK